MDDNVRSLRPVPSRPGDEDEVVLICRRPACSNPVVRAATGRRGAFCGKPCGRAFEREKAKAARTLAAAMEVARQYGLADVPSRSSTVAVESAVEAAVVAQALPEAIPHPDRKAATKPARISDAGAVMLRDLAHELQTSLTLLEGSTDPAVRDVSTRLREARDAAYRQLMGLEE